MIIFEHCPAIAQLLSGSVMPQPLLSFVFPSLWPRTHKCAGESTEDKEKEWRDRNHEQGLEEQTGIKYEVRRKKEENDGIIIIENWEWKEKANKKKKRIKRKMIMKKEKKEDNNEKKNKASCWCLEYERVYAFREVGE
jgi:quinol monooxygenase YgiN